MEMGGRPAGRAISAALKVRDPRPSSISADRARRAGMMLGHVRGGHPGPERWAMI
jgi:hypothetical protein